ncbi:MAG: dependent protein [Anaerophaga sp.]|uniref:YggS family pyridoxal phosphate-dependent enzyme n=1 Tax=Anaerophaga thermohalophila TaxID=177400 RepID=UPI000237BB08|nr:YggS family pyridoxal phosphate-dependent enzyme [Anaerophaga thermohalophila]MDK2842998.1 dependent protein [Anaerophaga sp.]MDN5290462.1 dependent protein [Anaerophaga sp.]
MASIAQNLNKLKEQLPSGVTLVAVSKTKPAEMIMEAYETGHRIFGENKVQELADKYEQLPKDIRWHMIGHLQRNKVKYIAPFVSLIHGVDSFRLLKTINKEAAKNNRIIPCLFQIHIADEETKFGLDENELFEILESADYKNLSNIQIKGLMGMATFTDDREKVRSEFRFLKTLFDKTKNNYFRSDDAFSILSMGMSGDYQIAVEEGSNMVRIGSAVFGERQYH